MKSRGWNWDAIRAISVERVLHDLGTVVLSNGSARCPLPDHDDKHPSFQLYRQKNRWHCYGCLRGGSVIDLVMLVSGYDLKEAGQWLLSEYTTEQHTPYIRPHLSRSVEPEDSISVKPGENNFAPDPEVYEWLLANSKIKESGKIYLRSRGISTRTSEHFKVGQIGNAEETLRSLIKRWGYSRVEQSGLLSSRSTTQNAKTVMRSQALAIPFFQNSICVYMQWRSIEATAKSDRWTNLRGISKPVYNLDALNNHSASAVAICEGVSDVLSAHELNWSAVGLLGAGSLWPTDALKSLRKFEVRLLPDVDTAGQNSSQRLEKQLVQAGIAVRVMNLPKGCNDLNDYLLLRRGGAN